MEMFIEILILSITFVGVSLVMKFSKSKRKNSSLCYPPAVPSLPLVGSLPFMSGFLKLEQYLTETSDKLGPIFSFRFGNRLFLALNTKDVIEEALMRNSAAFSGRMGFYSSKYLNKNRNGIISMNFTADFKKYHQLSMSVLKEFGFGVKRLMERRILREAEAMAIFVRSKDGQEFDPTEMALQGSSNVISNICLGKRQDYEYGPSNMAKYVTEAAANVSLGFEIAPSLLLLIPYFRRKLEYVLSIGQNLKSVVNEEIEKIKHDKTAECFVSSYLAKVDHDYDHKQLLHTVIDLLGAGTETTSSTLLWLLLFTANNPEKQELLHKEIDEVIPSDRLPSLDDQSKLPYFEATILEVMRIRTIAALALPHLTLRDSEVSGYFVPSGTIALPNLYAVHMDRNTWKDPDVFRPERFLDENNQVVGKDRIIPFSVGRRSCFGEVLARQEVFLFYTVLLQQFQVLPPKHVQHLSEETTGGIAKRPKPFEIRLIPRKETQF